MFDPPELSESVNRALRSLEAFLDIDAADLGEDFVDPGSDDYVAEDYDPIRADHAVSLSLPRCNTDSIPLTYGGLGAFADEVTHARLVDNAECWTPRRILVRIESDEYDSVRLIQSLCRDTSRSDLLAEASPSGRASVQVRITQGATIFGLLIVKSGEYDKYFPPADDLDFFLELTWEGEVPERAYLSEVIDLALFEVSFTIGLHVRRSPRPLLGYEEEELETAERASRPTLPISVAGGLAEVARLYNRAVASPDSEFKLLGFVKALEHVSEAVLRQTLTRAVQIKLRGPRALAPDYEYVSELEAIINDHRGRRKDREALRLTLIECCDPLELRHSAPGFLLIAKIGPESTDKERRVGMETLAACLSSTRNEIAHARASYMPTGEECPKEHLARLVECARVATGQAIRWYATLHESLHVR